MSGPIINPYVFAAGFSPPDLANLVSWIRPEELAGFTNDDPIGTWTAHIGTDWTQATAGAKPLNKTGSVNGFPAADFDGTDDFLENSYSANDADDTAQTWILVFKTDTAAAEQIFYWAGNEAGNGFGPEAEICLSFGHASDTLTNLYASFADGLPPSKSATFTDTTGYFIIVGNWNNLASGTVSSQVVVDGTESSASSAGTNNFATWGNVTKLGRPGLATRFFNGRIAEAALYKSLLSDADRQLWESYLQAKFGI